MGLLSGQYLDLDVTRGAPRFHDAVRALVGAAQEADGVPDKIFHRPDNHPEPVGAPPECPRDGHVAGNTRNSECV